MIKKILFLFGIVCGLAMNVMAQNADDNKIFVVKNGRIVSSYEIGKDIDNITFQKSISLDGNAVVVGEEKIEMKSAVVTQQDGMYYVYLSPLENAKTIADVASGDYYMQVAMSPTLLDEKITLSKFSEEFDEDESFQVSFMDKKKYDEDDNYEPPMFSSDDYSDLFTDGTLYLNISDDKLDFSFSGEAAEGAETFAAQYKGAYTEIKQNPYYFTVNDNRMDLRAAFAEKVADGIAFYLTPGNIDKANDLENTYYYIRLFVPTKEMDGTDIDIKGSREYELTFYDNATDVNNPQAVSLYTGYTGNGTGYVSVNDLGDGLYSVIVDVEGIGKDGDTDLQVVYRGTPDEYDLTIPSNYTVADNDPVDLKSCVVEVDKSNEDMFMYTVYLSQKEGITTVEGMTDADIVVTYPEDFLNDDQLHGFSGSETNALIAIKYAGETYCQANTGHAAGAIAAGGNARVTVNGDKANVDFTIFSSTKFGGSLKGHFEGNATRVTK